MWRPYWPEPVSVPVLGYVGGGDWLFPELIVARNYYFFRGSYSVL